MHKRTVVMWGTGALAVIGLLAGCSSDDSGGDDAGATSTEAPADDATTTTTAAAGSAQVREVVETLASDELAGREDNTEGSELAQDYLIEQLQTMAEPLAGDPSDADAYRSTFAAGTNLLAVIPGGELADEYVVVGAHYDHLGNDCDDVTPEDDICNGATDNATGVAAALEMGRAIAARDEPPRRSVILALWDREEDDLGGSAAFLADPPVPLEDMVTYVNFDIQGANLSPSLTGATVMVGAETGGPNLLAAAEAATEASTLDTLALSLLFGQGRSDHANFASSGVPTVFLTDANPPCYHTVGDDLSIVDFAKLDQQILTAQALTDELVVTDDVPEYDPDTPAASYEDAVSMQGIVSQAEPDFARFSPDDEAAAVQFLEDLDAMVAAGEEAFDDAAVRTLLEGSVTLVGALATGECEGFVD